MNQLMGVYLFSHKDRIYRVDKQNRVVTSCCSFKTPSSTKSYGEIVTSYSWNLYQPEPCQFILAEFAGISSLNHTLNESAVVSFKWNRNTLIVISILAQGRHKKKRFFQDLVLNYGWVGVKSPKLFSENICHVYMVYQTILSI